MIWGCIGWNGVGVLSEVEGRMDAEQYVVILKGGLLQSMEESGIPTDEVIFQQDNDPKHTSRRAQIWFEEQEIKLLDCPAQSLDLNHIKDTWNHLKRCLSGYDRGYYRGSSITGQGGDGVGEYFYGRVSKMDRKHAQKDSSSYQG